MSLKVNSGASHVMYNLNMDSQHEEVALYIKNAREMLKVSRMML